MENDSVRRNLLASRNVFNGIHGYMELNLSSLSVLLRRLSGDKLFYLSLLAGPFFWLSLYFGGTAITGPKWLSENKWLFLQVALLYPVVEELVFRGLLQESLWRTPLSRLSIYCVSMPNIVTSVLFTAFHFLAHPPLWAVGVFIPSLVYGFFRDRYERVLPAVLLHVFYNSGYFLLFGR